MNEDWLRLNAVPGIGPASFLKLIAAFGSPTQALSVNDEQWQRAGLSKRQLGLPRQAADIDIQADLEWLQQDQHHILTLEDPSYPPRLKQIPDPPPILYVIGDTSLLSYPQLAMVGSRNPTNSGASTAEAFAEYLAAHGLGITSGLAMGIDGAAHRGALKAGGITVAVAATGLDRIYPAKHRQLAHQIAAEGVIISEFRVGTGPLQQNFPRRNRIITGLSLGTLVVEAALKSGSLISARYAMEQGRELFAIPGSIHNPMARGCHHLIRQGAKLVETGADVLEELAPLLPTSLESIVPTAPNSEPETVNPDHLALLEFVDFDPTPIDTIIERSGLTADAVSSMLLIMELDGSVAAETGGCYVRLRS